MSSKITLGYKALLAKANSEIKTYTAEEAKEIFKRDDVVFVDLRDPRELAREGKIPNAFHCTRGMLEFWIDPESPYAKSIFQEDKTFVFYCASGWRSALSAQTAQNMGLAPVAHIEGGFTAWRDSGGEIETIEPRK